MEYVQNNLAAEEARNISNCLYSDKNARVYCNGVEIDVKNLIPHFDSMDKNLKTETLRLTRLSEYSLIIKQTFPPSWQYTRTIVNGKAVRVRYVISEKR
ncbi:MAG: hypothetical protein Q4G33_04495 [bacterium]|nr:hypothetical protein [bacterium]